MGIEIGRSRRPPRARVNAMPYWGGDDAQATMDSAGHMAGGRGGESMGRGTTRTDRGDRCHVRPCYGLQQHARGPLGLGGAHGRLPTVSSLTSTPPRAR